MPVVVDGHPDLQSALDCDAALEANRLHNLAGNYVVFTGHSSR